MVKILKPGRTTVTIYLSYTGSRDKFRIRMPTVQQGYLRHQATHDRLVVAIKLYDGRQVFAGLDAGCIYMLDEDKTLFQIDGLMHIDEAVVTDTMAFLEGSLDVGLSITDDELIFETYNVKIFHHGSSLSNHVLESEIPYVYCN